MGKDLHVCRYLICCPDVTSLQKESRKAEVRSVPRRRREIPRPPPLLRLLPSVSTTQGLLGTGKTYSGDGFPVYGSDANVSSCAKYFIVLLFSVYLDGVEVVDGACSRKVSHLSAISKSSPSPRGDKTDRAL